VTDEADSLVEALRQAKRDLDADAPATSSKTFNRARDLVELGLGDDAGDVDAAEAAIHRRLRVVGADVRQGRTTSFRDPQRAIDTIRDGMRRAEGISERPAYFRDHQSELRPPLTGGSVSRRRHRVWAAAAAVLALALTAGLVASRTVPRQAPDIARSRGPQLVSPGTAQQAGAGGGRATACYPGSPEVNVTPSEGPVTTPLTISGTGFCPNGSVDVIISGHVMGTADVDSFGYFTITLPIPDQSVFAQFPGQPFDIHGVEYDDLGRFRGGSVNSGTYTITG
jgi:hypothetical protein